MKPAEYRRQLLIGKTKEGRGITLEVALTKQGPEVTTTGEPIKHETVTHEKITEWLELSITGNIPQHGGGQVQDSLLESIAAFAPEVDHEKVSRIVEVWRTWHLNGVQAECVHQRNGFSSDPAISGQICSVTGYKYGSAWLIKVLPAEIVEEVKSWGRSTEELEEQERDRTAQEFLSRFGLEVKIAFKGDKAPAWGGDVHGDRYRVTIKRIPQMQGGSYRPVSRSPKSVSSDYWNSQNDKERGIRPTAYDILQMLAPDAFAPTDPDEVVREFGEMKPSQASAVAKCATKLQAFFTKEEQEALQEVRD